MNSAEYKKKIYSVLPFLCFLILIPQGNILSKDNNFYTRLYEKGKKMYLAGEFKEAEENLRIAQFGLQDDPKILKQVYLYYSLSNYRLNRGEKVIDITKRLLELYNVKRAEDIPKPDIIRIDLDAMFSAIYKDYSIPKQVKINKIGKADTKIKINKKSINKTKLFQKKFLELKNSLDSNNLTKISAGIKQLKKINKGDPRINYLQGIMLFRQGKYSKAEKELIKAKKIRINDLSDDLNYYLSLNYYFLKNYGQTQAFYQNISRNSLKKKLKDIVNKTREIRDTMIKKNVNVLFDKKLFQNTLKMFSGDYFVPRDVFQTAALKNSISLIQLKKYTKYCLTNKKIYERGFILVSSDFFFKKNDKKFAVKILSKSKFYDPPIAENIEIFYRLGIYYFRMRDKKRATFMFRVTNKLSPGFKKTYSYLDNLKNLH